MSGAKAKALFVDGEGPLVLKDLARDMAARIHGVYEPTIPSYFYFDTLSLYNAFLSEEGREPNQPGDTLALLVPHLLAYGIRDEDLRGEAAKAQIAPGVTDLIETLKQEGWEIRVISTAYSALWETVGSRLGLSHEQIASSRLSLDKLKVELDWRDSLSSWVKLQERLVIQDKGDIQFAQHRFRKGEGLQFIWREYLSETFPLVHNFYSHILPTEGFDPLRVVPIVGGSRKIDAILKFQSELSIGTDQVTFVGDSITDDQAQKFVRENGGLAIALNGDRYAIRNAEIAVALEDRMQLKGLLDAWVEGGLPRARSFVESQGVTSIGKERQTELSPNGPQLSLVEAEKVDILAEVHQVYREKSREGALPII